MEEQIEEYKQLSNSVYAFLVNQTVRDEEAFVGKKQLYRAYAKFCKQKFFSKLNQQQFKKKLETHDILDVRHQNKRVFSGVRLKYSAKNIPLFNRKILRGEKNIDEKGLKNVLGKCMQPNFFNLIIYITKLFKHFRSGLYG